MTPIKFFTGLFFIFILHGFIAWLNNQPQDAGPDVPSGKLRSLSFAPYHDGFSPIEQKYPLPEHIDEDLRLLADKAFNIRTYSILGGMQPTADFARQYGVNMIMGGWLGDGHQENRVEIQTLIEAANANPDVVKRVIVGNEVLLRKDMDIDSLIGYIRQVKQAIKQPVTYADVWSSYLKYPQLFNEVDFITIHILPYWEDEPVAIENAGAHVERIVEQIKAKARSMGQDKPILIGESGWPAAGRQRGLAIPGVVNEARFIRSLIQIANKQGFDYNIVEAFNQPWKSQNEGVVGANWGLLNLDREPVFSVTGPVTENPNWLVHFVWATALWLCLAAAGFKSLTALSLPRLLLFLTLAQLFTVCLVFLSDFLWHTSYNHWQRVYTLLIVAANAGMTALLLMRFQVLLSNQATSQKIANWLGNSLLFFVVLAVYKTFSLGINGRYLSFPIEQFLIPSLGVLGLIVCIRLKQGFIERNNLSFAYLTGSYHQKLAHRYLAYCLVTAAISLLIGETYSFMGAYDFIQAHPRFSEGLPVALSYTLQNRQLVGWLLCVLILAIPFWKQSTEQNPIPNSRGMD